MLVKNKKLIFAGLFLIFFVFSFSFILPFFYKISPFSINLDKRLSKPCFKAPFGTDELGRDLLARISYGGRISLSLSFVVTFLSLFTGTLLGSLSGWIGGIFDEVVGRVVDFFLAFPGIILALGIALLLGGGFFNLILALTIANTIEVLRISRAQTLKIKNMEFIKASLLMGSSSYKIITHHFFPHILPITLPHSLLSIPSIILSEAGLSFIGAGITPPIPSLGNIIAEGRYHLFEAVHLTLIPGLFLFVSVLGFNLVGESLEA
jgi:peptide/nickel transport system permease protein